MSYRPTISVYMNGHIADIGYYGNWNDADLFFEALATAALFHECKSIAEYNEKKFGRQKVYYAEENLEFLESCSEWPILVDLTAQCIYVSEGAKEKSELLALPSAREEIPAGGRISVRNIERVMSHCRIPFDHVEMDDILDMFLEYEELQNHLSTTVIELLEKEKRHQAGKMTGPAARSLFSTDE